MKNSQIWIIVISFLGTCLLALTFFLMFIVKPQQLHYYNLAVSTAVLLATIFVLSKTNIRRLVGLKNYILSFLAILFLGLFGFASFFLIKVRYGFPNWNYKNALTMYYDRDETMVNLNMAKLNKLSNRISTYKLVNGKFPEKIEDIPPEKGYKILIDSWDNPIVLEKTETAIIIRSAGLDQTFHTADDQIVELKE